MASGVLMAEVSGERVQGRQRSGWMDGVKMAMHECSGKHACMSSPFSIAILNGTFFFSLLQEKLYMPSGRYYTRCS